jgi:hypothetical protein
VAQWLAQTTHNRLVAGPTPAGPTFKMKKETNSAPKTRSNERTLIIIVSVALCAALIGFLLIVAAIFLFRSIWNNNIIVVVPAPFSKTSPANGATAVATGPTLSWDASSGADTYEYCYATTTGCSTFTSTGANTSVNLSGLSNNQVYYWQVRAVNPGGTTPANSGTFWSFTTILAPPGAFTKTSPVNGATGVATSPTLSWGVSSGAVSYEYCYAATTGCSTFTSTGTNTSVSLSGLSNNQIYYWQVRAVNSGGITPADNGTDWSFTTILAPPGAFSKTSPVNGASGVATSPTLSWGASSGAVSYEYCYATTTSCSTFTSTGTNTSVSLSGLSNNQVYYWQVRAINPDGTTLANTGTFWSFTTLALTPPGAFSKTSPVNGATGVATSPTLSWGASSGAVSYEYCYATTTGCSTFTSTGTNTSVSLSGLSNNQIYYWQVRAINPGGTTPANSDTFWSFTTQAAPPQTSQVVFGIQMDSLANRYLNLAANAKANWVGGIGLSWAAVETSPGLRNWSALASQEQQMRDVAGKGLIPIVNVRFTPAWAQLYAGYSCGPMQSIYFYAFGTFVHDLVARYSVPPYNVKYWEIWNEEDIDHTIVPPNSSYGCWGNSNDTYYGGGYYADMLKVVYPQIKAANPQAQVLVGGLLLDCDPRPGAGCTIVGHDAKPAMFLEGILHNGGGSYFDGVSFHAYDWYQGLGKYYTNPNWQSAWNTTGPSSIAKAQFIKNLLSTHGVSGKFLMDTESAVVCGWAGCDTADFETVKANYVAEVHAGAIAQGLKGNLWYSMSGWNNSGLIKTDLTPLPAYTTFQFSSSELRNSIWVRDITEYTGVKGYQFNRGDRQIWVLWSSDGNSHSISLPGVPLAVYHVNGTSIPPAGSISVTHEPLYFEWNP